MSSIPRGESLGGLDPRGAAAGGRTHGPPTAGGAAPSAAGEGVDVSIVVPVFNEAESLPILHAEVAKTMERSGRSWELVLVDDKSRDHSLGVMLALRRADRHVRVVQFRRNFGQTAAMAAGFDVARGRVVVTIDGDLQNDPADIPRLLAELERGYDVVAGWRRARQDNALLRKLPSLVANRLIALASGVEIHDTGCTLKAFRRELVDRLALYAEQHRFMPLLSAGRGARVAEVVVNHRPRRFGRSKYGLGRMARVLLDLISIKLIAQFSQRPLHYFGLLCMLCTAVGFAFAGVGLWGLGDLDFRGAAADALEINRWEYVIASICCLLFMMVVYFALLGLFAELVINASSLHRKGPLGRILSEQRA